MTAVESFVERVQRIRVAQGLSERDLAEPVGVTVRQYESWMHSGATPTSSLLVDFADALNVPLAELTDLVTGAPETLAQMRASLETSRRAALASLAHQMRSVDRRLARLSHGVAINGGSNTDAADWFALMRSVERNETLRACAGQYARLILQRCAGNKQQACRILGITYHTLRAYLQYTNGTRTTCLPSTP